MLFDVESVVAFIAAKISLPDGMPGAPVCQAALLAFTVVLNPSFPGSLELL